MVKKFIILPVVRIVNDVAANNLVRFFIPDDVFIIIA